MLKRKNVFLLYTSFLFTVSGHAWEFEQNVVINGVLRHAERSITKRYNGEIETKVEKSIVLVTDEPLALCRSVTIGKRQIASSDTSYPHIEVYLPEEFFPLIGKHVQCYGNFERSFDSHKNEIILHVNTALDDESPTHKLKTVFYEPEEIEVSGLLHEVTYPGPPEYTSIEMGDCREEAVILTLKEPINVEVKSKSVDDYNEAEQGVRELQVVFSNSIPSASQMKREVVLKGTLYHAHTGHHQRRVLMMVKSWENAGTPN